ncbi:hypothetical protein AMJ86_09725 [bacterium SM23_57]|nr:MAG: hypothetical protein AMJ86_09725 [bacterium SM23_57]
MSRWALLVLTAVCFIINPTLADITELFNLGITDVWESRWQDGAKHFQQAAQTDKNHELAPVAMFNAANIEFLVNQNNEKALELFWKVIDLSPQSVWAAESYRRMAEISQTADKQKEVAEYYGKALEIGATHQQQLTDAWITTVSMATAGILSKLGDIDATITLYSGLVDKITEGQPAAQVRYGLAEAYEAKGDLKQAATIYADVANYFTYTRPAAGLRGKRDMITEQVNYDWTAFDLLQQSQGQLRQGNREQAATLCQQVMDQYPDSPLTPWAKLVIIGRDVYATADFQHGVTEVTNMILENSDWPGNYILRRTVEQWEDFISRITEIEKNPDDFENRTQMGYRLLRSGAPNLAEQQFNYVLERDPENTGAHLGLGNTLLLTGNTEQAIPHFEMYLKENPNDGGTLNQLGYAFLGVREFDKAREMFQRYIEADTTEANAYDSMGECLFNEGKYEKSIAHYKKALQIDPSFSNSQFMLGENYKANSDTANAINAYQLYLQMDSGGRQANLAQMNLDSLQTGGK